MGDGGGGGGGGEGGSDPIRAGEWRRILRLCV